MNKNNSYITVARSESNIKKVSNKLISDTMEQAGHVPSKRLSLLFNNYEDRPIRSIKCLDTNAYIRPHMHEYPDLYEIMVALYGEFKLFVYNSKGVIIDIVNLSGDSSNQNNFKAIEMSPFTYHSLVCISDKGTLLEVTNITKDPNIPDMTFPNWAPEESSTKATELLQLLKKASIGTVIK
ncbi:MAG: WbuC family cupin fold metalloprotein [Solitalea-like symbiont of Acarus siro]